MHVLYNFLKVYTEVGAKILHSGTLEKGQFFRIIFRLFFCTKPYRVLHKLWQILHKWI